MSREKIQMVYKAVDLVTPEEARKLGIVTDNLSFISLNSMLPGFRSQVKATQYQIGSVVEMLEVRYPFDKGRNGKICGFPDLNSALANDFGQDIDLLAPFTGFMVIGEAIGGYTFEPVKDPLEDAAANYIVLDKMRVLGIKAFVEKSNTSMGYIEEVDYYLNSLQIAKRGKQTKGRLRYAFRVTQDSKVIFKELFNPARTKNR